ETAPPRRAQIPAVSGRPIDLPPPFWRAMLPKPRKRAVIATPDRPAQGGPAVNEGEGRARAPPVPPPQTPGVRCTPVKGQASSAAGLTLFLLPGRQTAGSAVLAPPGSTEQRPPCLHHHLRPFCTWTTTRGIGRRWRGCCATPATRSARP